MLVKLSLGFVNSSVVSARVSMSPSLFRNAVVSFGEIRFGSHVTFFGETQLAVGSR